MNIFAYKFCTSFELKADQGLLKFATEPIAEILDRLQHRKLDFPGQVFFAEAGDDPFFLDTLFEIQADPYIEDLPAKLVVLFDKKSIRKAFYKNYTKRFKVIHAAGGVPVDPLGRVLMIYRRGLWDLAKGKHDTGETSTACAWREVAEETGLKSHKVAEKLSSTRHIFSTRRNLILKKTWWYMMPCIGKEKLVPQIEEEITDVRWVPFSEIALQMPETFPLIEGVLREALFLYARKYS